jgi:protein-S-isoprenylcysteine O-methyltransferase Ste14
MHRVAGVEAYLVLWAWTIFAILFLLRSRVPSRSVARRDRRSLLGMGLQGVGFAAVWGIRRNPDGSAGAWELVRAAVILPLLVVSLVLTLGALRRLGKQWSLSARVLDEHDLITTGPYRWVRHPIYTGLLGMLIATGLAFSPLVALAIGVVVYVAGTLVRTRAEERLLRETFGERYDEYARRVPALLPRWPS